VTSTELFHESRYQMQGMHQYEAMWMSFGTVNAESHNAVKVSTGGLNALTGLPRNSVAKDRQDYLAVASYGSGQL
jgi:hypothetical protein